MTGFGKNVVILGSGPCGLGAAWRLTELGVTTFDLFEHHPYPGGLATSFVDENGFTWDIGGHVGFSHYDYYDRVMDSVLSDDQWLNHERESWVWMRERFIPYPFQYNIGRLPRKEMVECLEGLVSCAQDSSKPANFHEWIMSTFGDGIARHFLIPYNFKVWAYPPEEMNAGWVGERVAVSDVNRVFRNIVQSKDDVSWGPNNLFRFPRHGGTGRIWQQVAAHLPSEKLHFERRAVAIDLTQKIVRFQDGGTASYDCLISTMPIDRLLSMSCFPGYDERDRFVYSSSNIVGVGIKGETPAQLRTKCWMYFPEQDNPFYRVTVFSNYSPNNVPDGGYWSLMTEVSESAKKPVNHDTLVADVIRGLHNTKLLKRDAEIVSGWCHRVEYGYPTPFLRRDELLLKYLPPLKEAGIYSRGRFGAWKYECSNQDHTFMQGVEAVDNILFGAPELTVDHPSFVNSHRVR